MNALMQWLRKHKEQRGIMAQLRCGLITSKQQRTWPLLVRFGGIEGHKGAVVRTVAALYAAHPEESDKGGMGSLCRALRTENEIEIAHTDENKQGPMATRLLHLMSSETTELCMRVARLVLRAKNQGIPVNYEQLYADLLNWEKHHKRDGVREAWARQFWALKVDQDDNADLSDPKEQENAS